MNEEPKSIWRRSWKGPLGLFLWVISLTAVLSIMAFAVALNDGKSFGGAITISFIAGLVTACITLVGIGVVALVRWSCSWRNLRRVTFVLVCLATLVALFYAEENLRGKYAWKKFKAEWEAKGKRFDLASLAPPPVPDEQNFAMASVWVEAMCATMGKTNCRTWYGDKVDALDTTNLVSFRLEMQLDNGKYGQKYPDNSGGWQKGEKFGLKQWQDYFLLNKWHAYYRTISAAVATNSALSDGSCGLPMVEPATGIPLAVQPPDGTDTNTYSVLPEPQPSDDLKTWQRYYLTLLAPLKPDVTNFFPLPAQPQTPAGDVLSELSKFDSAIEALREASHLPYSRFPICYNDANPYAILLPHLASLKRCALVLRLRALAEVQSGQAERALDDIKLMLCLTESSRTEPFMISHLVRIAMVPLLLQPVWEGLADHRWTDAQLASLEADLGKLDFLADYNLALEGEMACAVGAIESVRHSKRPELDLLFGGMDRPSDPSYDFVGLLSRFAPGGWFEQNKLACSRLSVNLHGPIVNLETRTVSPARLASATNAYHEIRLTPYNWMMRIMFPWSFESPQKFAYGQWCVDAARIACALERYHLAHGNYPDTLDALAPQFLKTIPTDLINGQPLRYRRTFADRFMLYSVGWNETDDGGKLPPDEKGDFGYDQGDWVWPMPS